MMICEHLNGIEQRLKTPSGALYIDECTRCFDTAESGDGLRVCLTCFNCSCFEHASQHANACAHATALRISKKLNKIHHEVDLEEVSKLAIGTPGGFSAPPIDTFSISSYACCLLCLDSDEVQAESSALISAFVEELLRRPSASSQEQIDQWEEERTTCPHTLNVIQNEDAAKIQSKNISHCAECELKENLWLCLTCGALGCGREIYGGGGGKGHGLHHFYESKHAVVVKLGTITPEGGADVFCYECNDMKLDESLREHLHHVGIEVDQEQKTEKSMAELELAQNMNHEWSKVLEQGQEMTLLWGPAHTGLKNLGNSCYMASVIQVLFSFNSFRNRYFTEGQVHLLTCNSNEPWNCYQCQMGKLASGLLSGKYSMRPNSVDDKEGQAERAQVHDDDDDKDDDDDNDDGTQDTKSSVMQPGISPRMFKTFLTKAHAEFRSSRQQDAFEFIQFFLERVRREEHRYDVDPTNIFEFTVENRLQCLTCKRVRYSTFATYDMAIPIPDNATQIIKPADIQTGTPEEWPSVTLNQCLEEFALPSIAEDYACAFCSNKTTAQTTTRLKSAPEVLIVHVKRFVCPNFVPEKLGTRIVFDVNAPIDMEALRGHGLQHDEAELPHSTNEPQPAAPFEPNELMLVQLESMGIGRNRCIRALQAVDNAGAEPAMNWVFEHGDDEDIDKPLNLSSSSSSSSLDESAVMNLVAMGFADTRCRHALMQSNGNVERAVDWLFNHVDEDIEDMNTTHDELNECVEPGCMDKDAFKYHLVGAITHLGKSTGFGHYVAHVYNESTASWVYFNDNKVSTTHSSVLDSPYVYFFRREKPL